MRLEAEGQQVAVDSVGEVSGQLGLVHPAEAVLLHVRLNRSARNRKRT